MSDIMLIESRSMLDSPHVRENFQLAGDLARAGNRVTLFLIENGVLAARQSAAGLPSLANLTVLADAFSLRERAIRPDELNSTIKPSSLDPIVDAMAAGHKVTWF